MIENTLVQAGIAKLKSRQPVVTGSPANFKIRRPKVKVLEMEDVLFHLNSCVLMPSAPKGASSKDATDEMTTEERDRFELQQRTTGLKMLALTYKVIEENETWALLIAGHTDTSGTVAYNYTLSEQRANNVLYLLEQKREDWADLCYQRHRIEDYQQIMQHYNEKHPEWNCDPGEINNSWNSQTRTATENFFHANGISDDEVNKVANDGQHRWTVVAWLAVYDLYDKEIDDYLGEDEAGEGPKGPPPRDTCGGRAPEPTRPKRGTRLRFADVNHKVLGCGESFPIQNSLKNNYKSQQNRRVEILFFEAGEFPPIVMPLSPSEKMTHESVPIFHPKLMEHIYVDPFDLFAVQYHLRFVYFDRFNKKIQAVPEGLDIKAFDEKGDLIKSKTEFFKDNYIVKVEDDDGRKGIHFEFEVENTWVFSNQHDTVVIFATRDEVSKMPLAERFKYYDLPEKWSSENYWTRYDGKMDTGDRFETVMKERKKIKPYGGNVTDPSFPLVFSLDDLVLVDSKGSQDLSDRSKFSGSLKLGKDSRICLFHINDKKLTLYKPDPNDPQHTQLQFTENLITDTPIEPRLIIFAANFYDIWDKRAGQGSAPFNPKKHVRGCRAAVLDDKDCRYGEAIVNTNPESEHPAKDYFTHATGNYELHYIRYGCLFSDIKGFEERAFMMVYWSSRFKKHFNPKVKDAAHKKPVTDADIKTFADVGFKNARERWEEKPYSIEPQQSDPNFKTQVMPVFFFEPKFTNNGGPHKCLMSLSNDPDVGFMRTTDSQMCARQDHVDLPGVPKHTDIDGIKDGFLTVAHEIGHAMGQPDEYLNTQADTGNFFTEPYRQQPVRLAFGPNQFAMMINNDHLRLRYFWTWVLWFNDACKDGSKLKPILGERKFKVVYRFDQPAESGGGTSSRTYNYLRTDDQRNGTKPFSEEKSHATGTGSVDFNLHKMGEDESAWTGYLQVGSDIQRTPFAFDGILTVYIKLGYRFIDNPKNSKDKWDDTTRDAFMSAVKVEFRPRNLEAYLHLKDGKIRPDPQGKVDRDFKNTKLLYIPISHKNQSSSITHYDIRVVKGNGAKITKRSGKSLEVGEDISKVWLVNYILGKDDGASEATIALVADSQRLHYKDVTFARDWMRTKVGNNEFDFKTDFKKDPFEPEDI